MVCFAIPRCFLNVFLQHQLFFTYSVLQIVRCNFHTCRESTSIFGFAQRTAGDFIMRHSSNLVFNIATNPHGFSDSSHEYWANFSCRKWNESTLIFGFASRILGKYFHVQSETNPHWFSDSHHVDWVNLSSEKCCDTLLFGFAACTLGKHLMSEVLRIHMDFRILSAVRWPFFSPRNPTWTPRMSFAPRKCRSFWFNRLPVSCSLCPLLHPAIFTISRLLERFCHLYCLGSFILFEENFISGVYSFCRSSKQLVHDAKILFLII